MTISSLLMFWCRYKQCAHLKLYLENNFNIGNINMINSSAFYRELESIKANRRNQQSSLSNPEKSMLKFETFLNNNMVSIDNLIRKQARLPSPQPRKTKRKESEKLDISLNKQCQLMKIPNKKQLQPHRKASSISSASMMGELVASKQGQNIRIMELKESKHRRNISVDTKIQRDMKIDRSGSEQTKSFYVKLGDKPIHYDLKIEIRKFQSGSGEDDSLKHERSDTKIQIHPKAQYLNARKDKQKLQFLQNKSVLLRQQHKNSHGQFTMKEKDADNQAHTPSILNAQSSNRKKRRYVPSNFNRFFLKSSNSVKPKQNIENEEILSIPGYDNVSKFLNEDKIEETTIQFIEEDDPISQVSESNRLKQYGILSSKKTADCMMVTEFNKKSNKLVSYAEKNCEKRVEIASLTKIMTCILIINLADKLKLNIKQEKLIINQKAAKMPGTSAQLAYSDTLTVYEALHGLMLPSGNDAAAGLGHWGGKIIRKYCSIIEKINKIKNKQPKVSKLSNQFGKQKLSFQKLFIWHMNRTARILKLENTNFSNTHGLMNERAFSTARDVSKLTAFAMKNPVFAEIVGKSDFQCTLFNRTFCQYRKSQWVNTNKLLKVEGFVGVKTGVTPSAGPCLSSMYKLSEVSYLIIIVLNVKSMEFRFKQSLTLLKQYFSVNSRFKKELAALQKSNEQKKGSQTVESREDAEKANMTKNQNESLYDDEADSEDLQV